MFSVGASHFPIEKLPVKRISVIIPAYDEEDYLPTTLQHIANALAAVACPSEVIVVDNDSHDRTRQIAESLRARVVLENEHNISRVRNTGARHTTGDVLIFIDADTLVPETLFEKMVAVLANDRCLGGAVGVTYERPVRKWMTPYLSGWKFWARVFNMKQGAVQFCRKSSFEALGGYDETIFVGEDIEFYWRLSKLASRNDGYLELIEHPKVTTSARRFDKMSLWKALLFTHPIFIRLTWQKKSVWKDWYEEAVR